MSSGGSFNRSGRCSRSKRLPGADQQGHRAVRILFAAAAGEQNPCRIPIWSMVCVAGRRVEPVAVAGIGRLHGPGRFRCSCRRAPETTGGQDSAAVRIVAGSGADEPLSVRGSVRPYRSRRGRPRLELHNIRGIAVDWGAAIRVGESEACGRTARLALSSWRVGLLRGWGRWRKPACRCVRRRTLIHGA